MISGPGLVCLAYASYPLLRIGVGIYIRAFEGLFSHRGRKEPYECFRQVELVKRSSNDFLQVVCSQSNCIIQQTHTKKERKEKK